MPSTKKPDIVEKKKLKGRCFGLILRFLLLACVILVPVVLALGSRLPQIPFYIGKHITKDQ